MGDFIPVNEPLLDGNEKRYLSECIDSGWVSSDGPFVKKFEKAFGAYLGLPPGVSVCNGTAALETALHALGVQPGDEVIVPSFTIISCALAAIRLGARCVLVDIDPETWCMNVNDIERKITSHTKVIMAVHIYGHPVEMDPVMEIAEKYSLKILEDAAEVHGAEYFSRKRGSRWLRCGSLGDAAAFSFYANKIVTTGEGGMVLSRDPDVLEKAASYRNLCFKPEKRFYHEEIGYNFRMTNLQAAVGLAQLERINEFVAIKRRLGEYYQRRLSEIPCLHFQKEKPWAKSVYWMYAVELNPTLELTAEVVMARLRERKIDTRPFFLGLHAQPVLRELGMVHAENFPHTDAASRYGFYLPSGLTLTESKIDLVCKALADSVKDRF